MGAAQQIDIHGAKGGSSSPKTPTEAADSLRSTNLAKILIAVGEGPFAGTPAATDILLDGTPINDASGNVNFPNVKWEWRTGEVDQAYIPGIPSVENETTVNVELRNDTPWVRSLTNIQLSAVRVRLAWPALQQQDDEGNVGGYIIQYAIDVATDGGAYQQVLLESADGKTTTRYERSRRVDLPAATSGWQIRVRRITPNQNTNKIADTMLVAGLTEVIDAKLRYPNTALLYVEFDAEQFTNIPVVTVKCKGRQWQVPSNYDPVARTYTGVWDGTFKQAWTNNPAWITFGVCTEDRFGLGKRIKSFMVDKWELYRIAQYCDQLVSDGIGGQEPRFLCDMNLQGKTDAWGLLRDISAIYRGMTYWAQGQLVMQADMPRAQDFDYVFTRANVIDRRFSYGSASSKTRYTRAIVSYDNPANHYDTDVIPYSDLDLQRRFGDKPVEISAIGCTRASEAQRRGKWAVLTNNLDRTVSFKTGMEGAIPLPGYIIPVADSLLAGREIGGRISAVAGRIVTLDRDTQVKAGDRLVINLPSGKAEGRTIESVVSRAVTVTTAYSEAPIAQLQWAIDADDLAIPLYRVMSVKRATEGDYEISALQYEPSKFPAIDTGARLEERPISIIPITVVPPPTSVTLSSSTAIAQGLAVTTMTIGWPAVNGAVAYDVEWRKDNGNWIKVQRAGTTSVDITGIYSGGYLARVRAISAYDISSIWKSSTLTQLSGKTGTPPSITSLTATSLLFGIQLNWTFPPGAEDTQRTEIWYGPANDLDAATKLTDLAYPQSDYSMQQLKAGATLFFWARLVDRTGNIGPFYPIKDGVMGQASSDATAILDQIAGEITESALGQELLSKIDKIDLIDGNGPGSVNVRIDEVKTDLEGQVGEVNEAVRGVSDNLASQVESINSDVEAVRNDLQTQLDEIADVVDALEYDSAKAYLSGDSVRLGQKLYQAITDVPAEASPPDAAYWLDIGQIVEDANGLASRVELVETKVTDIDGELEAQSGRLEGFSAELHFQELDQLYAGDETDAQIADSLRVATGAATATESLTATVSQQDGKITAQGQRITGLTSELSDVAEDIGGIGSAVESLKTITTAQGDEISSQGQSLTQLNNSLTTTNSNVEAAQAAAQAAADKAGAKGEVIYSATAPIADKRLSQNLWIDTTGNANTPKRWNGSAWVAVTDKVATDAAKAAADALAQVDTKADASALQALTSEVTQQGDDIAANSGSLTQLTADLHFQELDQLYAGDETDAQIADSLRIATGAATATESLTATVTQHGDKLIAQGQSLTDLTAELTDIAGEFGGVGTAVEGLTTRVEAAEDSLSSQSQSLTQLTAGLKTTNTNVTAAQKAANDASTLAGGKGKVIVQAAAPAVADRLAQNLWIDITGGANTPKRWTGSAWVAVTDKVATDAATAASKALTQVATKADASALDALTNEVTQQGNEVTAVSRDVTQLSTDIHFQELDQLYAGDETDAQIADALTIASGAATATETLTATVTQQEDKITAQSESVTLLTSELSNVKGDVVTQGTAIETLKTTTTVQGDNLAVQGEALTQLNSRLISTQSGVEVNASAIGSTNTKVEEINGKVSTVASRIDGVYAQVNPVMAGDDSGELAGDDVEFVGVWSEQSARIEDGIAIGQKIENVQASVGEASAAVQVVSSAQADLEGKAEAMWAVKLQVNSQGQYVAAGVGLGIENGPAGLQSTFLVSADNFAVVNGINGTLSAPFAVTNGQVFIKDAFIANGSITMLKIGDSLQSDDYVAGVQGWRLAKNGTFEINGSVAGQGRMSMTNRSLRVYDGGGVKRVQLGDLTE